MKHYNAFIFCLLILFSFNAVAQNKWEFTIYFESGKAKISREQEDSLRKYFNCLVDRRIQEINLSSHTDSVGNVAANEKLSLKRLKSVRRFLSELIELDKTPIKSESHGEKEVLDSNLLAENRIVRIQVETQNIPRLIDEGEPNDSIGLYRYQKDKHPCNNYLNIVDIAKSKLYFHVPERQHSSVFEVRIGDIGKMCYGIIYYFPERNFRKIDSTGFFEENTYLKYSSCSGHWVDTISFSRRNVSIIKTNKGYYIFTSCHKKYRLCGVGNKCQLSIYVHKEIRNNISHLIWETPSLINFYNKPFFLLIEQSLPIVDLSYDNFPCRPYILKMMVKKNKKLWIINDSLNNFYRPNATYEYLDSLEERKINWKTEYIVLDSLHIINPSNLKLVKPTKKKLIIKDKHAAEAGLYFAEYGGFFPLKKGWFNKYNGKVIDDIPNRIAIRRGKKLYFEEDYLLTIRENKRRIKYKMKQLKFSEIKY